MGKANEGMYIYRRSYGSLSLMLSCVTVSVSCVVYSRGNRTPESEQKQASVDLIKRKMKKNILYMYSYQIRIYPLLLQQSQLVRTLTLPADNEFFRNVTNHR